MKEEGNMRTHMRGLASAAFVILFLLGAPSQATTFLSPAATTIGVGDTFDLSVSLSGNTWFRNTTLMAFGLKYDAAVIDPTAVNFGSFFTSEFGASSFSIADDISTIDIITMTVSGGSLPATILDNELFATITFQGINPGFTEFLRGGNAQSGCCFSDGEFDFKDINVAEATVVSPVPLPAPFLLLFSAIAALGLFKQRRVLPAALPLFLTALAGLGLVARRRRQEANAS